MTHKILIIGAGSIGERHLRCFLRSGRATIALCEINSSLREKIRRQYEVERTYDCLEDSLNESHDAAVIAVPAHLHIAMAQKCAARGLHLLIEKPLSVNLEGASELCQDVSDRRLIAATAYVYRASPALSAMRKEIASGRFGKPIELIAVAGQNFPTYRPAYSQTYYADRAAGGGAIQDALTHVINASEWLVGPVTRVVADADHKMLPGVDVEDVVHVLARHGTVIASYSLNQFQAPNEITITVVCERGTARFEFHNQRWRWMDVPDSPWNEEPAVSLERDSLFVTQADSFLNAMERGQSPLCTFEEGLQTLRANLAILRSTASHAWERVQEA
jgi:predicted dehydrogenase